MTVDNRREEAARASWVVFTAEMSANKPVIAKGSPVASRFVT